MHHSKFVKAWLEENKEQIEVHYLPLYSPDMNPDEYLNGDLKQGIRASSPARNQGQLEKKVLGHLRMVQCTTSASDQLLFSSLYSVRGIVYLNAGLIIGF